jgi:hypothetical protein
MDELQLLWGQFVHLYHDLEVITRKIGDLIHREGKFDLNKTQMNALGIYSSFYPVYNKIQYNTIQNNFLVHDTASNGHLSSALITQLPQIASISHSCTHPAH